MPPPTITTRWFCMLQSFNDVVCGTCDRALADRTRKLLADHAAQLRLHELSAFCDGEFRDNFDALGPFELCQAMRLKEVSEFGHCGSDLVVASDDERADALSIGRIWHADDRGRGDRRVRIARPFDLL